MIILIFLIGLFFYAKCYDPEYVEGLTSNNNSNNNISTGGPAQYVFVYDNGLMKVYKLTTLIHQFIEMQMGVYPTKVEQLN